MRQSSRMKRILREGAVSRLHDVSQSINYVVFSVAWGVGDEKTPVSRRHRNGWLPVKYRSCSAELGRRTESRVQIGRRGRAARGNSDGSRRTLRARSHRR